MHSPARIHADHTPPSLAPASPWRRFPSWTASLCPTRLLDHEHRHARHQRIHHMAMPENVGRDLPSGELLSARNLLGPGLFCQAIYCPKHRLGAQVSDFRPGKSHTWPRPDWTACKVPVSPGWPRFADQIASTAGA